MFPENEHAKEMITGFLREGTEFSKEYLPASAGAFIQLLENGEHAEFSLMRTAELYRMIYRTDRALFSDSLKYGDFCGRLRKISELVCSDDQLCGTIKNMLISDLAEFIRFASVQKKNIKDNAAYNRHLEKVLTDMNRETAALYDLGTDGSELAAVLDKYFEFVCGVNTVCAWEEYYSLPESGGFKEYTASKYSEVLALFRRGNLNAQALSPYIKAGDIQAKELLQSFYSDMLEENTEKAKEIESTGLLGL